MPSLHTRGHLPAARCFKPLCTNYHTDIIRLYLTFSVTLSAAPLWTASTESYLKSTDSSRWCGQGLKIKGDISYFSWLWFFWWSVIIVSFNFFPTSDLPKPSSSSDVMNSTCNVRYLEYFTFKIWVCGEVWTHFHNAILKTLWCVKFGATELHPPVLTRVKEYNKSGHHRSALTQQVSVYSLNSLSLQNHIRTSRRADTRACFIFCQIVRCYR